MLASVEDCKDVLDTLGGEQFYCGELGSGATTKIVNNLVSLLGRYFAWRGGNAGRCSRARPGAAARGNEQHGGKYTFMGARA